MQTAGYGDVVPLDWTALEAPVGTSDALTRAVLVLAGLLLLRTALATGLRVARRLPVRLGRASTAVARAVRPGLARRVLAGVLGLGVPATVSVAALPVASAHVIDATAQPAGPTRIGPVVPVAPRGAEPRTATVVVPGDTLWDIARRHLPSGASAADVARAWPRWYAANRAVIGPDPDLLHPGMRLQSPDRRSTGTSTSSLDRPRATGADADAVARSLDPDRR